MDQRVEEGGEMEEKKREGRRKEGREEDIYITTIHCTDGSVSFPELTHESYMGLNLAYTQCT